MLHQVNLADQKNLAENISQGHISIFRQFNTEKSHITQKGADLRVVMFYSKLGYVLFFGLGKNNCLPPVPFFQRKPRLLEGAIFVIVNPVNVLVFLTHLLPSGWIQPPTQSSGGLVVGWIQGCASTDDIGHTKPQETYWFLYRCQNKPVKTQSVFLWPLRFSYFLKLPSGCICEKNSRNNYRCQSKNTD